MKLGWTGKCTFGGNGGIFTLGGTGRIVTLRGTGGIFNLGDGSGTVRTADCGGTLMGSTGFAMALSNILERSTMACFWVSPNW